MKSNEITTRQMPSATDIEAPVLGSILAGYISFNDVKHILTKEHFYDSKHAVIFEIMGSLNSENEVIDIITVTQELKKKRKLEFVGGAYALMQLTNLTMDKSLGYSMFALNGLLVKRKTIDLVKKAENQAYMIEEDPTKTLYSVIDNLRKIEREFFQQEAKKTSEIGSELRKQIMTSKERKGILGLHIHITELNIKIYGFQGGFVYIIAARPSIGKSSLLKSLMLGSVKRKVKCKLFSLEQTGRQCLASFISEEAEIDNEVMSRGELTEYQWQAFDKAEEMISKYLEIDDTAAITIAYFESQVRKFKEEGGQLIGLDYLQLMTVSRADGINTTMREQVVSYLSANIKRIAKENDIPIILLSQLSRKVEERGNKQPQLSDLRESGSIEQDAEVVLFLHRPEFYKIYEDANGNNLRGITKIICAKNRFGRTFEAKCKFIGKLTKFQNLIEEIPFEETAEIVTDGEEDPF